MATAADALETSDDAPSTDAGATGQDETGDTVDAGETGGGDSAHAAEAAVDAESAEPERINLFRRIRETRDTVRGELDPFARWADPDPELFPARPATDQAGGTEEPSAVEDTHSAPSEGPDSPADAVAKPESQASDPPPGRAAGRTGSGGEGRPLSRPLVSPWPEDDRPRPAQHRLEAKPVRPVELEWDPKPERAAEVKAGAETEAESGLASDQGASGPAERPTPAPPLWDHHGEDLKPWLTSLLEHNRAATGSVRDYEEDRRGRTVRRVLAVIAATLLISVLILALLVGAGVVDLQGVVDAVGVGMQAAPDQPTTAAVTVPGAPGLVAVLPLPGDV